MDKHYKVVIVGGGSAGISVAARLVKASKSLERKVAIIDPADKHYYQPLWTLVGGGISKKENSERDMKSVIPKDAIWIQDAVDSFEPDQHFISTESGRKISYDYLVVAAGIDVHWDGIKGLKETLGKNNVCSNYSYEHVDYTWEVIRDFEGGQAVFSHPNTPIKCGGAPQKIMYLADDYFCKAGVREKTNIIFGSANEAIFDVLKYRQSLEKVIEKKGITVNFGCHLIEVRAAQKEAVFEHLATGEQEVIKYDMLHAVPPMQAPAFIKKSALADSSGWVDVHPYTLQHKRYKNVFGLGDNSNLPTSKTGAAIRKQAPVVVKNLLNMVSGKPLDARYDGYSSCPIVTGYNRLILAEFNYDKEPAESFPINQAKERMSMFMMKKYFLPAMYWNGMLKGIM